MVRFVLCIFLMVGACGCVAPLLLVGAGAVGGYAVTRDTFEGITSKSQDEIWDAANKVATIMGAVEGNDRRRGEIDAKINGASVHITLVQVNLTTTKLRVKARKGIFPSIGIAQEVYTKIINQLE